MIFTLFTSEANYEDELDLAQEVIDSLEADPGDSSNDDSTTRTRRRSLRTTKRRPRPRTTIEGRRRARG